MGFDDRYRLSAQALVTDAAGRLLFLRLTACLAGGAPAFGVVGAP